jgi:hypothetical protein
MVYHMQPLGRKVMGTLTLTWTTCVQVGISWELYNVSSVMKAVVARYVIRGFSIRIPALRSVIHVYTPVIHNV